MNLTHEKAAFDAVRLNIRKTLDQEWKSEGSSQEELEISRRLSDLFACEVAAGRAPAEIESEWEHKTTEEILREHSLPIPPTAARS